MVLGNDDFDELAHAESNTHVSLTERRTIHPSNRITGGTFLVFGVFRLTYSSGYYSGWKECHAYGQTCTRKFLRPRQTTRSRAQHFARSAYVPEARPIDGRGNPQNRKTFVFPCLSSFSHEPCPVPTDPLTACARRFRAVLPCRHALAALVYFRLYSIFVLRILFCSSAHLERRLACAGQSGRQSPASRTRPDSDERQVTARRQFDTVREGAGRKNEAGLKRVTSHAGSGVGGWIVLHADIEVSE